MDKFEVKNEEFLQIAKECLEQFEKKNKHYGNDYFEGNYSELERWMSIKRKVARLNAFYSGASRESLPDETLKDTWKDLAIYCIMEMIILKNGEKENKR